MTTPITTWQELLMASVSTPTQAAAAHAAGWRTFRVDSEAQPGEVVCPASKEAGQKTQCDRCALCSGALAPTALRALAARARMASIMPAWRVRVRPMLRALGARANGVELWRGPSALDETPVVVVATGVRKATANTNTKPRRPDRTRGSAGIVSTDPARHAARGTHPATSERGKPHAAYTTHGRADATRRSRRRRPARCSRAPASGAVVGATPTRHRSQCGRRRPQG
jgi:hypothetical protein